MNLIRRLFEVAALGTLGACGTTCVARGCRVRTPAGDVPIETLRVGDTVVVIDPSTGASAVSRLSAIRSSRRECGLLELGAARLFVTTDHPLYDPDERAFFPAGDWLLGKRTALLEVSASGEARPSHVSAATTFSRLDEVFDLSVEHDWHTFVAEGVVVHNKQKVETCPLPDGGTVIQWQAQQQCTCPQGVTSYWECEGGEAVCVNCSTVDAGP